VVTNTERLACGAVVIAGGAWTAEVAANLKAPIPVHPVRGQIVHVQLDGAATETWPIAQPLLGHYLVPWEDGRVAIGATVEAEAGFDHRPSVPGLRQLLRELKRVAPGLASAAFLEVRVGLRPGSPDDLPVLGRVPGYDNVFVATGYGADGLLLSPYSGRVVAELVAGGEDRVPAAFGPGRFGR
jgi:D-amino-acid dehydrogenase